MGLQDELDEEWRRMRERSAQVPHPYEAPVRELAQSGFVDGARKAGE